jgi:hypothetical protein
VALLALILSLLLGGLLIVLAMVLACLSGVAIAEALGPEYQRHRT